LPLKNDSSVSRLKYEILVERNALIPMSDGIILAADVYRPDAPGKFPALLMLLPYRKDDRLRSSYKYQREYMVKRGYAWVHVDIRGTGSSEGVTKYMFSLQEQQDGYEAVEWMAKQSWCDGNVGMLGASYGCYTSLLTASKNPPHLKAIVPICGSANWYREACMGGMFYLQYLMGGYGARMLAMNSLPPHPDPDGRWIEIWNHRLKNNEPWLISWLKNPEDGPIWREGSLLHQPGEVKVPTFIIDSWHDIDPSGTFHLYESLKVPKKILIGPWMHENPDTSAVSPRVNHMYEILRWFDYWLKGIETGVTDEPPVAIFIQRQGILDLPETPAGEWRYEDKWPIESESKSLYLHPEGLLDNHPCTEHASTEDKLQYDPTVGTAGGIYQNNSVGLPLDQRSDEIFSLTYTTSPLKTDMEVTGIPKPFLYISSSAEITMFSVKLCDVSPDGSSSLVSRGVLNVTHRESHEHPTLIEPGKITEIEIEMDATAYLFEKDHRIRLGVSSADFPNFWPTPRPAVNTIHHSNIHKSRIVLPIVPEKIKSRAPSFQPPSPDREKIAEEKRAALPPVWSIKNDIVNGRVEVKVGYEENGVIDKRTNYLWILNSRMSTSKTDPGDTRVRTNCVYIIKGPLFKVKSEGVTIIQSSRESFNTSLNVDVELEDRPYFNKSWAISVPRRYC